MTYANIMRTSAGRGDPNGHVFSALLQTTLGRACVLHVYMEEKLAIERRMAGIATSGNGCESTIRICHSVLDSDGTVQTAEHSATIPSELQDRGSRDHGVRKCR